MESFRDQPLVVLAEDDPDQSALVEHWIDEARMRSVVCADAESLIDTLELSLPDVVCLDAGLPGLRASQTMSLIRRRHPHVPVVMVTDDTLSLIHI